MMSSASEQSARGSYRVVCSTCTRSHFVLLFNFECVLPASTIPASSGAIRAAPHHAQVVVPVSPNNPSSGGIQFHNNFEALRRNDEDDVPIDGGHEVFGDESDTESFLDSVHGGGQVVEEAIPMELRPRVVNFGLEVLDGVDLFV